MAERNRFNSDKVAEVSYASELSNHDVEVTVLTIASYPR
jgi:hypothetical protein